MTFDPDLQARVTDITGAHRTEDVAAVGTEQAFAAIGLDSPAVMGAPVAIYSVDMLGRIRSWNRACEDLFGWRAEEVLGEMVPFVPTEDLDDSLSGLRELIDGAEMEGIEFSPLHRDGHRLHVVTSATVLRSPDGTPTAILAFATDITAKRAATEALERAHHKWQHLLANIGDTVVVVGADGTVRESTGDLTAFFGPDSDGWSGRNIFDVVHPDDLPRARTVWDRLWQAPGAEEREVLRTRRADGRYEMIEINAVSLVHDPVIDGVVMTARNVTAAQRAEALLADEARVLELIARDAPLDETLPAVTRLVEYHSGGCSCLLLLAPNGRFLQVGSPGSVPDALLDLLVSTPLDFSPTGEVLDLRRQMIVPDYELDPRFAPYADRYHDAGAHAGWAVPVIENRSDELLGVISTYYDEPRSPTDHELEVAGVASHLAAIAIERDRFQRELFHQARHHQLTGLPNRSLILEELESAIERARRQRRSLAVMFVDLDRFKIINDSLGHAAGDKLLVRFGGRLRNLVRPGDFVGHFGADEFVVLLEDIADDESVRFVANRLDLALGEPFGLDEGEVFLSASVGVAIAERGEGRADVLIQQADAAMFRAKDLGRDRLEIFDEELRSRAVEQLRIDRDLRLAVERAELVLHYQPVVDMETATVVGAEALLRWQHPERGLVHPADFIGAAEETGIIVRIGRWVLEEAVHQARTWAERHPRHHDFVISVNLSARQITEPGLVDQVRRVLERYAWPGEQLVLELTESILIDDRDATLDVLTQLKALGVRLAIDDFGTGFSSLNYLHRFPVDIVKIDRAFVANLRADADGSPVVTAIMHMAHALSLEAAAEGVESEAQRDGLRRLGCDVAQGYLFAHPLPSEEFEALIDAVLPL